MVNDEKNVETKKKLQKSYFDVLGLCCSSEVPLIENILKTLEGVKDVSVIVPSRTVIVVHDNLLVSQLQIVKALNQARLEANVRLYGDTNYKKKWPSPYTIICGVLLLLSLFKYVYHPFQWLAIGAVAVGILPIALRGIAAIRNLTLDINILALIAVVGTIFLKDYLEAATIVFLFTIAEWLESRASHKATAVMSSLMNMAPQKAVIAETGEVVAADEVKVNTVLAVKAGEVIPIDGIVVEGKSEVDEKALTGESFPVPKEENSIVWAGTINLNGYISVITTALAEDCVVAKMAKLVEEAQNSKSRTQRFIDKCAKYYTPAVLCISVGLAVIPAALRVHNENHWFHLALVVLVSGCPCALILSTPVATFCALSQAATSGILIKGGDYLEIMSKIKIMAFDKTGTITRGEFVVTDFRSLHDDDISLNTLLYWVSSIESKSSHPMAPALVEYGRSHSIEPKPEIVEDFQNYPGEGIHGKIGGRDIYVGNKKIAQRAGCQTVPTLEGEDKIGKTIGYVYCGATPAGVFNLSDACRSGVTEAIQELKSLGIKTAMLTGDSNAAAMQAQEQLGHALELVHAELLPEDKARIIAEFKEDGPTAMIGDGINDAPALATADIGISMGITGSALATETGQVILMSNDIRKIPKAIQLARGCQRKVIQNVILSITTKAAILALAFAGHPLVWAAVLADVGTCLLVILNSMLLLRGTHKHGGKCNKSSSTSIFHKQGCHDDHSSHAHQHSSYDSAGTKKMCEPEGSYSQRCASKHGCHDDHSAHAHQHSCSDAGTKKTCEPKGCSFQMGDSKHGCHDDHSAHAHQHSCSDSAGTKKMCEPKGCSSQRCASKHGCHEDHSAHAHQHSCSDSAGAKKMCEPKVCSSQRCASNSQSGTSNSSLCEDKTCNESAETTERDVDNEHFLVTCKDLHNMHNHGCEETPISNSCGVKKCTDSVDMVSCSSLNNLNHAHTSSERGQQKRSHGHLHCSNVKDHKDSDESHNTAEHFHPPNRKVCCGSKKHDTQLSKPLHTTIDIVMSSCHGESSGMHACPSLEKRESGGCCKSFRKESCSKHGHFGTGFGPGLSEIVIE